MTHKPMYAAKAQSKSFKLIGPTLHDMYWLS